jgi:hypothetical protein
MPAAAVAVRAFHSNNGHDLFLAALSELIHFNQQIAGYFRGQQQLLDVDPGAPGLCLAF